jgi:hypothetical protein
MSTTCWRIINLKSGIQEAPTDIKFVEELDTEKCLVILTNGFRKVVRHGERITIGCENLIADNLDEPANTANISHAEPTNSWRAAFKNTRHLINIFPKPRLNFFLSLVSLAVFIPINVSRSSIAEAPELHPIKPASAQLLAYLDKAVHNANNLSTESPQTPATTREEMVPKESPRIKPAPSKKRASTATPVGMRTAVDSEIMRFLPEEKK